MRNINNDLDKNYHIIKDKYSKAENKIIVEKKLDEKEIDRLNNQIGNLHKEFKINKMPRNMNKNESCDDEIKASMDKISDKNSDGNMGGMNNNMFVNLAQHKTNNHQHNSY